MQAIMREGKGKFLDNHDSINLSLPQANKATENIKWLLGSAIPGEGFSVD